MKVRTDEGGRMIPEELDKSIKQVRSEGRLPFFVIATSGSTVLGAYDELDKLAEVCRYKYFIYDNLDPEPSQRAWIYTLQLSKSHA